jgi:hypothetical protein
VTPIAPPTPPAGEPGLVALAGALADLLERETKLVRAMEIAKIAPLQPEKTRLTQHFQQALKMLDMNALPEAARLKWLVAGKRLAAAAMENERALRIGRAAVERVVAAVVSALSQSRRPPTAYSGRRSPPPVARVAGIAVDHRL